MVNFKILLGYEELATSSGKIKVHCSSIQTENITKAVQEASAQEIYLVPTLQGQPDHQMDHLRWWRALSCNKPETHSLNIYIVSEHY